MKTKVLTICVLAAVLAIGSAAQTFAAQIQWAVSEGGNGHYYERFDNATITWTQAQSAAESMGGYLATVASAAENNFITDLLPVTPTWDETFFLGGFQNDPSTTPSDNWQWLTGEAWGFENWRSGEPSDATNNGRPYEDRLEIYTHPDVRGTWNDIHREEPRTGGYIVEIPEPATLGLLLLGGLAMLRRKNR